jgi:hypothetical protein
MQMISRLGAAAAPPGGRRPTCASTQLRHADLFLQQQQVPVWCGRAGAPALARARSGVRRVTGRCAAGAGALGRRVGAGWRTCAQLSRANKPLARVIICMHA